MPRSGTCCLQYPKPLVLRREASAPIQTKLWLVLVLQSLTRDLFSARLWSPALAAWNQRLIAWKRQHSACFIRNHCKQLAFKLQGHQSAYCHRLLSSWSSEYCAWNFYKFTSDSCAHFQLRESSESNLWPWPQLHLSWNYFALASVYWTFELLAVLMTIVGPIGSSFWYWWLSSILKRLLLTRSWLTRSQWPSLLMRAFPW